MQRSVGRGLLRSSSDGDRYRSNSMNPSLMSIDQVAEDLGWSRTTICRLIDQGVLEVVRGVHKNRRILRRSVEALINGENSGMHADIRRLRRSA